MKLPESAARVIERLERAGYEAYAVGGCVRDSLLGHEPSDWDVTTSAKPELLLSLFSEPPFRAIPTGLAHGTVTVLAGMDAVEVTAFRVDGEYTDRRRPDSVSFAASLAEDLSRRDFTVNAMAYSPSRGLVDLHGGRADLERRLIRCVGDPEKRFSEDALRILRAVRFASVLCFGIESETAAAALRERRSLARISRERLTAELVKLLKGRNAARVISEYRPILAELVPDIAEDSAKAVELIHSLCINPSPALLLAALVRDTEVKSLAALRLDKKTLARARLIASSQSEPMREPVDARRLCARCGIDAAREAAVLAAARGAANADFIGLIDKVRESGGCVSLRELETDGNKLKALGVPPERVGGLLAYLLDRVLAEPGLNTPERLAALVCERLENQSERNNTDHERGTTL